MRRLMRDVKRLQNKKQTSSDYGAPIDKNIMIWSAVILGPHDTSFEDGTFELTIKFTEVFQ